MTHPCQSPQCNALIPVEEQFCNATCREAYRVREDELIDSCIKIHEFVENGQIGHAMVLIREVCGE